MDALQRSATYGFILVDHTDEALHLQPLSKHKITAHTRSTFWLRLQSKLSVRSGNISSAMGSFTSNTEAIFSRKFKFETALSTLLAFGLGWLLLLVLLMKRKKGKLPPAVPGLPIFGNLLQLIGKKPHHYFTLLSEKYGPIYRIHAGMTTQVIINSSDVAKEALVTNYESISTRELGTSLSLLTKEKTMVAMSDYGDFYKNVRKMVTNNLLGQIPQKSFRQLREAQLNKVLDMMFEGLQESSGTLNARSYISRIMFSLAMQQIMGRDPDDFYFPEVGRMTRLELSQIIVDDMMKGAIMIDWRDFFPAIKKWIPNKTLVEDVKKIERRRTQVIRALIDEHKKLLEEGKVSPSCYCSILLTQYTHLTEDELIMSVWEPLIESSDTTVVTTEWALYELALKPHIQEQVYKEIQDVAGSRMVTEDHIPNLPFLKAVVKETMRKYSPVPMLPPRFVHKDVELGGYTVTKGSNIIVNIHAIHHDKKVWTNPEEWNPLRILKDEKLDMGYTDMRIMPFGGGKRICGGITQAMYMVPLTLAAFVQHFKFSLPSHDPAKESLHDTVYLTNHKLHPLMVIATPRVPERLSIC